MDREQQLKEIAYDLHRELGRSATMTEINAIISERNKNAGDQCIEEPIREHSDEPGRHRQEP